MQEAESGFERVEDNIHLWSSCCVPSPGNCRHKSTVVFAFLEILVSLLILCMEAG